LAKNTSEPILNQRTLATILYSTFTSAAFIRFIKVYSIVFAQLAFRFTINTVTSQTIKIELATKSALLVYQYLSQNTAVVIYLLVALNSLRIYSGVGPGDAFELDGF